MCTFFHKTNHFLWNRKSRIQAEREPTPPPDRIAIPHQRCGRMSPTSSHPGSPCWDESWSWNQLGRFLWQYYLDMEWILRNSYWNGLRPWIKLRTFQYSLWGNEEIANGQLGRNGRNRTDEWPLNLEVTSQSKRLHFICYLISSPK